MGNEKIKDKSKPQRHDPFDGLSFEEYYNIHLNGGVPPDPLQHVAGVSSRAGVPPAVSHNSKVAKPPHTATIRRWANRYAQHYYKKISSCFRGPIHEQTPDAIKAAIENVIIPQKSINKFGDPVYINVLISRLISRSEQEIKSKMVSNFTPSTLEEGYRLFVRYIKRFGDSQGKNYNAKKLEEFRDQEIKKRNIESPQLRQATAEQICLCFRAQRKKRGAVVYNSFFLASCLR